MLYKSISVLDSPFNLASTDTSDLINQNSLVLDVDSTLDVVVNLPSINSLIYGADANNNKAGSISFYIKGNIVRGANNLVINADVDDKICGTANSILTGVGASFSLFIAGLNSWGIFTCGVVRPAFPLGAARTYIVLTPAALTVGTPAQVITTGNVGQLGSPTGTMVFLAGGDFPAPASTPAVTDAATTYAALVIAGGAGLSLGVGAVNLDVSNAGGGNYAAGKYRAGAYTAGGAFGTLANGIVTLDGDGDYVFYTAAAFTTGANTTFVLINGAKASRVFFATGAAFTTGANSIIKGTFISPAGMTMGANTQLEGRILSTVAAVSLGAGANIYELPTA